MKKILILLIILTFFIIAGCYTTQKTDFKSVAPVTTNSIEIKDFSFNPQIVKVKAGTTITWTNQDTAKHTVKLEEIESPSLTKGQTWSYSFITPGTYNYICGLHPSMKATIIVE